jgi:hypothetical protein
MEVTKSCAAQRPGPFPCPTRRRQAAADPIAAMTDEGSNRTQAPHRQGQKPSIHWPKVYRKEKTWLGGFEPMTSTAQLARDRPRVKCNFLQLARLERSADNAEVMGSNPAPHSRLSGNIVSPEQPLLQFIGRAHAHNTHTDQPTHAPLACWRRSPSLIPASQPTSSSKACTMHVVRRLLQCCFTAVHLVFSPRPSLGRP